MKNTFIGLLLLVAQSGFAGQTCPDGQYCLDKPTYNGYEFLANTAKELTYASYGNGNYPSDVKKIRAHRVCKFLGYNSATFAKVKSTWDDLVAVDKNGFADVVEVSYASYPNTSFDKLNCK